MAEPTRVLVPSSAEEASRLFRDDPTMTVVGGGTIMIPRLALRPRRARAAMLLHRAGLVGVRRDDARVTIGAMTTLAALVDTPDPLRAAAAHVGDREIRRQATIGGNLCASNADAPPGDVQGALIALAASVRSTGPGGERVDPVERFLPACQDRLVLDVAFDEPVAGAFVCLDRPHTHDYTALAVSVARTRDAGVRIGVTGGCRVVALSSPDDAASVQFDDDALASAWYRRRTLPVLISRALAALEEAA